MNKAERNTNILRTILLVCLFALVGVGMCSAQNKALTRFSNDVALETGSIVLHEDYDETYKINVSYLKPSVWDVKIDMYNLQTMINEDKNMKMVMAWRFMNHAGLGPNYTCVVMQNNELFTIILLIKQEMIVVSDFSKEMEGNLI